MKRKKLLFSLLALASVVLQAQADPVQLASWTFDTGYTVEDNVYTPNDGEWAEVSTQWFSAVQPLIAANEAVSITKPFYVTGKTSRYWQICSGWNNHVFRVVNDTEIGRAHV